MSYPLLAILTGGNATRAGLFPELPGSASGLPRPTRSPCGGAACGRCRDICPTGAVSVLDEDGAGAVSLDRGLCVGCRSCIDICPSGTLAEDRTTKTATRTREELVLTNRPRTERAGSPASRIFGRSIAIREVSTGCSATDLEVAAVMNPIFDAARFGITFVASPRFADALLVTGPVGRAMREPLLRCFEAMAEPRIVIAVGASAISGGLHRDGYAEARGVTELLPVAAFVPGCPPHPWSIIDGIMLAMERRAARRRTRA